MISKVESLSWNYQCDHCGAMYHQGGAYQMVQVGGWSLPPIPNGWIVFGMGALPQVQKVYCGANCYTMSQVTSMLEQLDE